MDIFQGIALAAGMIVGACLLVLAGRGANWLAWRLGRKRRAVRDAALNARVRAELAPGEELLWVDREKSQPLAGLFFTLLGFWAFLFFAVLLVLSIGELNALLWVFIPMVCFGLLLMNLGTFGLFRRGRNYFFVTTRRLAFRGRSIMGMRIHKDVQACQIKDVALVDYRMYLVHVHYRVRVTFDDAKGRTRREEVMPERDPERFATVVKALSQGGTDILICAKSIL